VESGCSGFRHLLRNSSRLCESSPPHQRAATMISELVFRSIDIALAGLEIEFSHGLQDIRIKPSPLIPFGFSDADF
jgi:hypothetical protein